MNIPEKLSEVTSEFVIAVLHTRYPETKVKSLSVLDAVHGTATKARLQLEYDAETDMPKVMWLKAGLEPHTDKMKRNGIYSREARAYAELVPDLPIKAPRTFGALYDEDRLAGAILLEDLSGADFKINSPLDVIPREQAEAMLDQMALMHAATCSRDWLDQRAWITRIEDYVRPDSYMARATSAEGFKKLLSLPRSDELPVEIRNPAALAAAYSRIGEWSASLKNQCALHGDFHVGNTYVDAAGTPGVLDWQSVRRGGWAFDVAYYICSSFTVEKRRLWERELLQRYMEKFEAAGGFHMPWEEAWRGYLICLTRGFVGWLSNDITLQPENYNRIVAARFAWAMCDHETLTRPL